MDGYDNNDNYDNIISPFGAGNGNNDSVTDFNNANAYNYTGFENNSADGYDNYNGYDNNSADGYDNYNGYDNNSADGYDNYNDFSNGTSNGHENYNSFDNITADGYDNQYGYSDSNVDNFNSANNFSNTASGNDGYANMDNDMGTPLVDIPTKRSQSSLDIDRNFAESTESTLNSLGAELTPAEIEDMKREKAARRRKQMLREKRRRERQRQALIRCSILLVAAILVIVILVKIFAGIGGLIKNAKKSKKTTEVVTTEATTTEEPVAQIDEAIVAKEIPATREDALTLLTEQGETNSDIKNIVENQAVYPDIVLQHLAVNSELIDFTLFYPAQINIPFDGDFTINTDTSEIPLFLEYDSQWAYADYGKTVIGLNGAAPCALSMAYVFLTEDGSKNPIIIGDFSMEKEYLDEEGHTDNKLMTEGAKELGLESAELDMDKDNIISALEEGNAIICEVLPGDFTKDKSYIVIKSFKDGLFYVNDPTSAARSAVGWDYKRLSSQISAMWSLKRGSAPISTGDDETNTDGETGNDDGTDNGENTDGEADDGNTDGGANDGNADGGNADSAADGGETGNNE